MWMHPIRGVGNVMACAHALWRSALMTKSCWMMMNVFVGDNKAYKWPVGCD